MSSNRTDCFGSVAHCHERARGFSPLCDHDHSAVHGLLLCSYCTVGETVPVLPNLGPLKGGPLSLEAQRDHKSKSSL